MRYFKTVEPWITRKGRISYSEEIISEDEIIDYYYNYWASKMIKALKESQVNRENCLNDWIIIHHAVEVEGEHNV